MGLQYPINSDCCWTIQVNAGKNILLELGDVFQLEYDDGCPRDSIRINDIDGYYVVMCGRVQGSLTSTSNTLEIRFISDGGDDEYEEKGFSMSYKEIESDGLFKGQ